MRTLLTVCVAVGLVAGPTPAANLPWQRFGPPAGDLRTLLANPASPQALLAAVGGLDLYASHDGGASWRWSATGLPRSAEPTALAADPATPGRFFAAGALLVYRSDDHGRRWRRVSGPDFAPFPVEGALPSRCLLAVPGRRDALLFAGQSLGPLWRSDDGGEHWTSVPGVENLLFLATVPGGPGGKPGSVWAGNATTIWRSDDGRHFQPTAPLPRDARPYMLTATGTVAYVTDGRAVFRTRDRGASWQTVLAEADRVTISALASDPDHPATVYAGRSLDGPFAQEPAILASFDSGGSWRVSGSGLLRGAVRGLVVGPGRRVLAHGDRDLARSSDRGRTWASRVVAGGQTLAVFASNQLHFDPRHPEIAHAILGGRPFASGDAGASWRPLAQDPQGSWDQIYDLAYDPVRPGLLWAAGGRGVFASTNGGRSWGTPVGTSADPVLALAMPRRTIMVAAGWDLARSADRGRTWTSASLIDAPPVPDRIFTQLLIDPTSPERLLTRALVVELIWGHLTAIGRETWQTVDGGRTFRLLPVAIATYAADGTLFGATAGQLLRSADRGATWEAVGASLPGSVGDLVVDPLAQGQLLAIVNTPTAKLLLRSVDAGLTWRSAAVGLSGLDTLLAERLWADARVPHRFFLSSDRAGLSAATWTP